MTTANISSTAPTRKIRISEKYLRTLSNYTHWCSGKLFQPRIISDQEITLWDGSKVSELEYWKLLALQNPTQGGTLRLTDFVIADSNGLTASELMYAFETHGRADSMPCSEPDILQLYVQGKRSRDWHVTEWRLGVKQRLFIPEEFFGALGLRTAKEFESIFGRALDLHILARLARLGVDTEMQAFWIKKALLQEDDVRPAMDVE